MKRQLNCHLDIFLICRFFMWLLVSYYLLMQSFITEEPSRQSVSGRMRQSTHSLCSAAQQRGEKYHRAFQRRRTSQVTFHKQTASTKGICLKNSAGPASVFCKREENSQEQSSFLSVLERSYLHVKRWVKAGVAVETSLITARLGDVLLKCSGHSSRSNSWRQETSDNLTFSPTPLNPLVSSSCVYWGKFKTAE